MSIWEKQILYKNPKKRLALANTCKHRKKKHLIVKNLKQVKLLNRLQYLMILISLGIFLRGLDVL